MNLGVRWTIGDVSDAGFDALGLSIWGAWKLFGPEAEYVVCVNSVRLGEVRARTGPVPDAVQWRDVTLELPEWIASYLDSEMAEGVGWKFAPLRVFPDKHELALDNDCILWEMPSSVAHWLRHGGSVIAEDVRPCFGRFARFCGDAPRNSGIRGLSAGLRFEESLRDLLRSEGGRLTSELDEQGLQVAALMQCSRPGVVTVDEVTICSPFPPHRKTPGTCGVHFVGLNARQLPWCYYDRPATELIQENWHWHRPWVEKRVGMPAGARSDRTRTYAS